MIAIIEAASGRVVAIVDDTEGMDMEGRFVADLPEEYDAMAVSHVWADGGWQRNSVSALSRLRAERDQRLAECDWTQLPDVPAATSAAWQDYRQALRDLPETADPFAPEWPARPA